MAMALPFVGAAVGWGIGGTFLGVSAVSWGWMAGSLLASATSGQHHRGPRLQDLTVTGTDYGQSIPWIAGSPRLAPNYIWASPLREIANTEKAGKGGGNKYTSYTYEVDVGLRLTENITEGVSRDWLNAELVRSGGPVKAGIWNSVSVYTGASDQMPDPVYESHYGAGNVSAFRGGTTVVIQGLQLGNGKQLPNLEHQISVIPVLRSDLLFYAPFDVNYNDIADPDNIISPTVVEALPTFGFNLTTLGFFDDAITYVGTPAPTQTIAKVQYDSARYDLGTADFTIGMRVFIEAYDTGGGAQLVHIDRASNALQNIRINVTDAGLLVRIASNDYTFAAPLNQWFTLGISRTDGYCKVWIDYELELTVFAPSAGSLGDRIRLYGNDSANRHAAARLDDFFIITGADLFTLDQVNDEKTPTYQGGDTLLFEALRGLLARAGYAIDEYDVSTSLNQVLHGYATADVSSTRAHLETLRPFGLYEASCSDKLYIRPRATTPVGTVDWADLGASDSAGEPQDPFAIKAGNESEVPAQIAVRYRNVSADWNIGTEFSDRLISSQVSTQVIEMPFGLLPAQAKAIADTMLMDVLAGLGRATLSVPGRKYAKYQPGDVLETTDPQGRTYRFRILSIQDMLFMQQWEVVLDDAAALESSGITYEGYVPSTEPARVAPTDFEVMAIRPLRDADVEHSGPYVAITPAKDSEDDEWPGAVFVRARLSEAFEQEFTSGNACVMGTCLTTLGDFSGTSAQVQRTGKLRVRVRGELSSANFYDFFQNRTVNAALVGNEPIRFMTAEFIANDGQFKVYDLFNFLRGQLGMEDQIAGHVSSERFVLLNNSVRRMVNETTDIGQEQQVKAVTLNFLLDDVADEDFTDDGMALRPLSPVWLLADPSGGDLALTWSRRSRRVARFTDTGCFTPLGELVEAYRVKVFDDPDADPVRTTVVNTPAWTYAGADIASDGFLPGDPITITVQQLSDQVGEGDARILETSAP